MICKWYNGNKFSDKVDHICVGDFHLIFFIFIGQGFFNKEQTKLCFVMVLLRIFYLIRHWVRIMKSVLAFICLYRKIPVIISGFILIQTHFFFKGGGGIYSGELLTGGTYNRRNIFVWKIILLSFYFLSFRNKIQNEAAFNCLHIYSLSCV